MNSRILKIGHPIIKYSQDYAFISAAMYDDISIQNWILNNAIQVYYIPQNTKFNLSYFYLGIEPNPINNIPLLEHQIVKMDFLKKSSMDLIEFTNLMIENGYYVTNTLDEYYLETRTSYKKIHYDHGILIYGYNGKTKQIFSAGYDSSEHFNCSPISYHTYEEAFNSTTRNSRISCFKRNNKQCNIDRELIKQLTYEFVNSINSSLNYRALQSPMNDCSWGIDAFRKLNDSRDIRYVYMFYEYILLMKKRAIALNCDSIATDLNLLVKEANVLLNLAIKEDIRNKKTSTYSMRLENILDCLKEILNNFIFLI